MPLQDLDLQGGFTSPGRNKLAYGIDLLQIQKYTAFTFYTSIKKKKRKTL